MAEHPFTPEVVRMLLELDALAESDPEAYEEEIQHIHQQAIQEGRTSMEFPLTIASQEDFDALIGDRLRRAKGESAQEIERLQAELAAVRDAQEQQVAAVRSEAKQREINREVKYLLESSGVERKRIETIRSLLDLEGVEPGAPKELTSRVNKLYEQTPELFGEGVRPSWKHFAADANAGGSQPTITRER